MIIGPITPEYFKSYCFRVSSSGMIIEAFNHSGPDTDMADNFHRWEMALKVASCNVEYSQDPSQKRLDELSYNGLTFLKEAVDRLK